jgi:glycosyltransferase involved in cell wall biosynthesis
MTDLRDSRAPRISVVIPTYNAAATLPETLESVFGQSFTDFEVIVVDDGSTDATPDILAAYEDRIRVLRKVNEGKPAAARNLGVRAARGEFVAFLDADDCWTKDKLERQVAMLDQQPDVGLVYTGDATIDGESRKVSVNPCYPEARGRIYELLTVHNVMVGSSVVARRRAIEEAGGFDEDLTSIENWDLWIRIARGWAIEYIDEPLTLYRVHSGNRSRNVELRRSNIFRVLAKHHGAADRTPEGRRRQREAYFHAYFNVLGKAYVGRLEMGPARRALWQALWLKPGRDVLRLLCLTMLGKRGFLALRSVKRWKLGTT